MLGVGVIGVGGWTETCHIPGIAAHRDARVVALCGRTAERRQAQAARFGVETTFADYADLIAHPAVDAVTISTPNRWHHPIARAALLAGKHVFCEKPLTMHHQESADLVALAEAQDLVHHVAFTFRFLYAAHEARRLFRSGAIGSLRRVVALTEWHWGLRPDGAARWRGDADLAGYGILGDMGSHLVDLARFVTGGEVRRIRGARWRVGRPVRPDGDRPGAMREVTADDETEALCDFAGPGFEASLALVASSLTPPPNRTHLEFIGDDGYIRLPYSRGEVDTLYVGRGGSQPEAVPLPDGAKPEPNHCLFKMMGTFVDACIGRPARPPCDQPATFADGHAVQIALDGIARAARSGEAVEV